AREKQSRFRGLQRILRVDKCEHWGVEASSVVGIIHLTQGKRSRQDYHTSITCVGLALSSLLKVVIRAWLVLAINWCLSIMVHCHGVYARGGGHIKKLNGVGKSLCLWGLAVLPEVCSLGHGPC